MGSIAQFARRTALVGLGAIFLLFALNPVLRWGVANAGRSLTGAVVHVNRVRADLLKGYITVSGLRAVDPNDRSSQLFQVGRMDIALDTSSLLQRQFVIRRAEISDLILSSDRAAGSALTEAASAAYIAELHQRYAGMGRNWLAYASDHLHAAQQGDLPSVRLAGELLSRWPGELDGLERRAVDLRSKLLLLETTIKEAGQNPLRNAQQHQSALVEVEQTASQLAAIQVELDRIQQQILLDQDAIDQARHSDRHRRNARSLRDPLTALALDEYLLGKEVTRNVETIIYRMRWSRQFLPALFQQTAGVSGRGREIQFAGTDLRPSIVIDELILRGTHRSEPAIPFEGRICGLSSDPGFRTGPIELIAQTTNASPCRVEATIHGTRAESQDILRVNCPNLQVEPMVLGDERQLAFHVAPGNAHLWTELHFNGNRLSGEIIIKRKNLSLSPVIAQEFQCTEVASLVHAAAEKVRSLEARVLVNGTLDRPSWSIESNLGAELCREMQQSVINAVDVKQQNRLQEAHVETDQQFTLLKQQLDAKRDVIAELVSFSQDALDRVRNSIAHRNGVPNAALSPSSPLR